MQEDELGDLNKVNVGPNIGKNLGQNVEPMGVGLPPEMPSHEEKKAELARALHKDELLPHLRTYHGDIAEFIKSKDQSLSDIALKQNEKKREEKREEKKEETTEEKKRVEEEGGPGQRRFSELPQNFLIYALSICLFVGAVAVGAYLLVFNQNRGPVNVLAEKNIIAAEHVVALDSVAATTDTLEETFESLRASPEYKKGITAIVISDASKKAIIPVEDLVKGFELNMPSALRRSLSDEYLLGLYSDSFQNFFLIIKVKDYGIAYRDMLEWEKSLVKDFEPILKADDAGPGALYPFKDLIVKNKDTRAAVSNAGRLRLIYTFLDKQIVLITESETALKGLLDAYVAGNAVR